MKINNRFWEGKKVFVTGGTGFVGSHLVSRLISLGADVKLFIHIALPTDESLRGFTGSLMFSPASLTDYLNEFQPDIVFHLAAQPIVGIAIEKEWATAEINIKGTYTLLHACKEIPSINAFLHVSTDKVFGKVEEIRDDSPLLGFAHPYNATKLCGDIMAQMYAEAYNLPITIVRNGNVYGPGDLHWDRLIPGTIKQLFYDKNPIWRGGSRDYIYIDDIIYGYLRLVEERYGKTGLEIVNLGAEQSTDTLILIAKIRQFMNKMNMETIIGSLWKGELVNQHIMNGNAQRLISWCPEISLDDGLLTTVKWYEDYLKKEQNG